MTTNTPDILKKIVSRKQVEVATAKAATPISELIARENSGDIILISTELNMLSPELSTGD